MTTQLHLICYDLHARREARDYQGFWEELKRLGAFRGLESNWWLERDDITTVALRDRLARYIDAGDRLLVVRVSDWAGRWLKATASDTAKAA